MTTRAVIYARYSDDRKQGPTSIEDQVRLCREFVERQGWQLMEVFADAGITGHVLARPGYQALLQTAARRGCHVIVAEALDRLSRDQQDTAGLLKTAQFHDIKIVTLSEGEIGELHVGLKGTMNSLYSKDLAKKAWRGQHGRVAAGVVPGGNSYGYEVVPHYDTKGHRVGGDRRIIEVQAEIIRRIFREFAAGSSPRAIAERLNREGIPGPRGREWGDSSIRGSLERGTGILNNELYIGRIVWNRLRYQRHPQTRKRVSRSNPASELHTSDAPQLRIVDDELWARVKARQAEIGHEMARDESGNALNRAHRQDYLLSGLLKCGVCGGPYVGQGRDLFACSRHRKGGKCSNSRSVRRQDLERRMFDGIRERLLAPELVQTYVAELQAHLDADARAASTRQTALRKEAAEIERKIGRLMKVIEDGDVSTSPSMLNRLSEHEARKAEIDAELRSLPEQASVVRLPSSFAEFYRRKVSAVEEALNDPAVKDEATTLIRSLVERIVLTPEADGGMKATLYGTLSQLVGVCEAAKEKRPAAVAGGAVLSVVAGAGFEPTTFRL